MNLMGKTKTGIGAHEKTLSEGLLGRTWFLVSLPTDPSFAINGPYKVLRGLQEGSQVPAAGSMSIAESRGQS